MSRFTYMVCIACVFLQVHAAEQWLVVTEDAPPLQYVIDGEVKGKSTEIVREVIQEAGMQAEFVVYPWARAFETARTRPNTLIYSMIRRPERESMFHWIGKIGRFQLSFVTLRENTGFSITSTAQAKQCIIGAMRDDFTHQYLNGEGFADSDLVIRSTLYELLNLLYKGRIDSFLVDQHLVGDLAEQLGFNSAEMQVAYLVPDLAVDIYLASNKHSDPETVTKLIVAFNKVNSQH
ncbi:MAG: substrate-binding periplasmic protein [Aestuariibacter sp.]